MNKIAAIILENDKEEILLYLRDNKSSIPFPNHWDLFGGHVEAGETPEQALVRELKEELDIDLKEYEFYKKYTVTKGDVAPNIKYVYTGKISKDISQLVLKEGQSLKFFTKNEIPKVKFANVLKDIVIEYIKDKNL